MNRKKIPTEQELTTIKEMVKQNESYSSIGRKLNISPNTIKRMIKDHNVDTSNYDIYKNNLKRILITKEQQKIISDLLNSGHGKVYVANQLGINLSSLNNIISRYNIDISKYKKPGSRTKILTEEQISKLQDMLNKKMKYVDIAKNFNVNRNLISVYIKRYNLIAKKDEHFNKDFTKQQIKILRYMSTKQISLQKICLCFNRGKEFITKTLKDNNIQLSYNSKKQMNPETLIDCASKCTSIIGDKSERNNLTKKELDEIFVLITQMPFKDMCDKLNKNYRFIKKIFMICGKNYLLSPDSILDYSYKDIFDLDMINPNNGNSMLAMKYGLSHETIRSWRKNKYGDLETRTNNFYNKSTAEIMFEEILKTLDLTFFYQKEICGYNVDYYLGQKLIVEVQGSYWHTKVKNNRNIFKEDEIKRKTLEQNNYKVLQIWEKDIKNCSQKVAETVISEYLLLITSKK